MKASIESAAHGAAGTTGTVSAVDLQRRLAESPGDGSRRLIALAGPPASGKSTLAESLGERLPDAIVVPMDGFHLDNRLLDAAGLRERKGAPETFDVAGLDTLLGRIVADAGTVHVPLFDRQADLSRAAAASVLPQHRLVIVEGNYLLLDEAPWSALARHFDLTVLLEVDEDELERRLLQRWLEHGCDADEAMRRASRNDLPNGRRVLSGSRAAQLRYRG